MRAEVHVTAVFQQVRHGHAIMSGELPGSIPLVSPLLQPIHRHQSGDFAAHCNLAPPLETASSRKDHMRDREFPLVLEIEELALP